ncbi:DUF1583 domain-containing protein [Aeoliella sp. ICT_H6.2]|uniref:DUF1583 domain-containing protein n=1 Tax=Aeoliella straminimaris TaxID=2954799 RepID=A0A9X2FI40_9BACT|nr:DUF1583 domain-containing protein [Aeoliella straminimaris]MCO6045541.1 DUF1583 domain-containing protein [Aeoliella straminimaris]
MNRQGSNTNRVPTGSMAALALVGMIAVGGLAPSSNGQVIRLNNGQSSSDKKSDHANRCLAAIDLAIMAARGGAIDVSTEAMRRACRQGPPVASINLGGILGSPQQNTVVRASPSSSNNPTDNAQQRLSKRLQELQEVWKEAEIDPATAYEVWKTIVFPPDRPNEGFSYSTLPPPSTSMSYGSVSIDVEKPPRGKSGAESLVYWARKADQLDDLNTTLDARRRLPGAADTVLLIDSVLASDDATSEEAAEEVCERMASQATSLVNSPNAELLIGSAWELVGKLGDDSPAARRLTDAVLREVRGKPRWGANEWFKYLVASNLKQSIESGEVERFEAAADLSMSYYDEIRAGNESYVTSREANLYSLAARRAFEKGHAKLGTACVRRLATFPTDNQYGGIDLRQLVDPGHEMMQGLLSLPHEERRGALGELSWTIPALGVHDCSHLVPTDEIPELFLESANGTDALPSHGVAGDHRICLTLIEWTLREQLAAGKEKEILEHIAELEDQKSDDADLARLMLLLAKDEPLQAGLLTEVQDGGDVRLRIPAMDADRAHHFDTEILQHALADPDLHEQAQKLVNERLKVAQDRLQGDEVAWLRRLKMQFDENRGSRTNTSLAHWVVSNDLHIGDLRDGRYPRSTWVEIEPGHWGHQTGPNLSYLLLRYPLEGDFAVTFRMKDAGWEEGAASLGGMVVEFLRHEGRLLFRGLSERGEEELKTDTMKADTMNQYRLDCQSGRMSLVVGDNAFETELGDYHASFPFLSMVCYSFRATSFDEVQITGDYQIPREVQLVSPLLVGWTAKFYRGLLPEVELSEGRSIVAKEVEHPRAQWRYEDGEICSVNFVEGGDMQGQDADSEPYKEKRREAVLQYMRPLCDGEKITLEFYYEPGKFHLTPTVGRIGMLLDAEEVALHWLTCNNVAWTGVAQDNRVIDPAAEQLAPPELQEGAWNEMQIELDGDTITLSINGKPVYRRTWEQGLDRRFGLFHDPTSYHVRVRNVKLSGNWPEKLPKDFFEQAKSDNL